MCVCALAASPSFRDDGAVEEPLRGKRSAFPFLQKKPELDAANALYEVEDTENPTELDDHQRLNEMGPISNSPVVCDQRHYELEGYIPRFELPGKCSSPSLAHLKRNSI